MVQHHGKTRSSLRGIVCHHPRFRTQYRSHLPSLNWFVYVRALFCFLLLSPKPRREWKHCELWKHAHSFQNFGWVFRGEFGISNINHDMIGGLKLYQKYFFRRMCGYVDQNTILPAITQSRDWFDQNWDIWSSPSRFAEIGMEERRVRGKGGQMNGRATTATQFALSSVCHREVPFSPCQARVVLFRFPPVFWYPNTGIRCQWRN